MGAGLEVLEMELTPPLKGVILHPQILGDVFPHRNLIHEEGVKVESMWLKQSSTMLVPVPVS